MEITFSLIKEFVIKEILTLPELYPLTNHLNVLLNGSRAVGGYSDKSDVDLDIICSEEVYHRIQKSIFENGCEQEWVAAGYNNIDDYFLS